MFLYNSEEEEPFNWKTLYDDLNSVTHFNYYIRIRKAWKEKERNKNGKYLITLEGVCDKPIGSLQCLTTLEEHPN